MNDEPASRVMSDRDRMVKTEFHNLDSHLQEWQQIAERLKDQMAPGVFNMVEVTQRLAEPMLEAQKALRSVADQLIAGHSQLSELAKSMARPSWTR